MLVTKSEFYGHKIYNDKICNALNLCKQTVYKLWLHCVRRHQALSLEQMIEFAPYMEEQLRMYDKFVDKDGKTTLNMPEYMQLRKDLAKKKE